MLDCLTRLHEATTNAATVNGAVQTSLYHMSEVSVSDEIARTFHLAREQTARVYALADNGTPGENWIIRWLLFHLSGEAPVN